MDAIAISLAARGSYVGLAPLGTSLTGLQARQLFDLDPEPVIATDADVAGRAAASRDYWLLTPHTARPLVAKLPESMDPAHLVYTGQSEALAHALANARPLGGILIEARILSGQPGDVLAAARVLAAMPAAVWGEHAAEIAHKSGVTNNLVRTVLASTVRAWNESPQRAAAAWVADQAREPRLARPRDQEYVGIPDAPRGGPGVRADEEADTSAPRL